ncbi:hypothetical protein BT96DRAFT_1012556 [Gymnopus androsaceus JB14]|uniref:Uncharacterized protein n=1 Tax=Gymnopus androsaceus JB14 TaxID=1447944 RepID=A0A6A4IL11_9AGAR|nr:hypothetical protein BT96DRAFT_1012556 [Gymnopus androsaceus JB14]
MPSQLSFFLNLSTSLLGLPRAGKGFPKLLLLFPRGLASKILLGTACICFSIQIFTKGADVHQTRAKGGKTLSCDKGSGPGCGTVAEESKGPRELREVRSLDRELPYFLDEKDVDFDPSLIWNQQDEEIARRHSALVRSWEEMEIKHDWTRNASKEVNRAYDVEKEERKRILEKVSYLRSTRFLTEIEFNALLSLHLYHSSDCTLADDNPTLDGYPADIRASLFSSTIS